MSEAEAQPQPTPEPAEQPPSAIEGIALNFDDLEAGDLEDMEEYCGRPVFGLISAAMASAPEDGDLLVALMANLPAKVFTAILGVAKRHQDPTFGLDQWRSIKLFRQVAAEPVPFDEPPAEPTPIHGSTGKRDSKSGKRTSSEPTSKPG